MTPAGTRADTAANANASFDPIQTDSNWSGETNPVQVNGVQGDTSCRLRCESCVLVQGHCTKTQLNQTQNCLLISFVWLLIQVSVNHTYTFKPTLFISSYHFCPHIHRFSILRTNQFDQIGYVVQGGPSGHGLAYVDIKSKFLSQDKLIMKGISKIEVNIS